MDSPDLTSDPRSIKFFVPPTRADDSLSRGVIGFSQRFLIDPVPGRSARGEDLRTTRLLPEKRWVARLLWRSDDIQFPHSHPQAKSRLLGVQHKVQKLPKFGCKYRKKIQNIETSYVCKLTAVQTPVRISKTIYLISPFLTQTNRES